MVPQAGLEPARPCRQQILSLPRLPFRHWGYPIGMADHSEDDSSVNCLRTVE
jgi:hypothetical protein